MMGIIFAAAGLLALVVGCAPSASATPGPAVTTPSAIVPGGPALALDKRSVDLGTVARDQEGIQTFLVMNRGDRPLRVGQVSVDVEQGCDEVEVVKGNIEIQSGELALLPIKLGRHRELGTHTLVVNLTSNDPIRAASSATIHFVVAESEAPPTTGPRLRVDKDVIDIGAVPYDWPLYEQFTLRNDGDEPLILQTPDVRVEEGC